MMKSLGLKVSVLVASVALIMSLVVPISADEANAGAITLEASREEALEVGVGETKVLDLNGFEMTGKVANKGILTIKDSRGTGKITVTGNHAVFNTGTLTIEGGTFDALSHAKVALWNDPTGTVIVNDGTFLRSNEAGSDSTTNGGNSYYNVLNRGTMTINGGTVSQKGSYSSLVENGWSNGSQNTGGLDSKMIINGGTFSGGLNTIKNDDYGNLKINGGTFKNVAQASLLNWNVAEITGGTFTSNGGVILNAYSNATMDKGELTINGGTFKSGNNKPVISPMETIETFGTIFVAGGTYNSSIGVDVKEGYNTYQVGNMFKVAPKATKIELSATSLIIGIDKTASLTSVVTPNESLDKVVYTSNDKTIATVSEVGLVTAKKDGTTKITATAGDKTATCTVTVDAGDASVGPETPEIPTLKPSNPTEVEVGIKDEASKAVITNTVDNILKDIMGGKDVPTSVMSFDTVKAIKEALASGKTVVPVVGNRLVKENEVAKELVTKVNELVAKIEKTNGTKAVVAQYLDLGVTLTADGNALGSVNQLEKPVTFTVTLPQDLQKDGRVFYVVRIHDGIAEKLETSMTDGTVTFKTDKFSTFALVYEETVSSDNVTNTKSSAINTGDNSNIMLFTSVSGITLVLAALLIYKKNK